MELGSSQASTGDIKCPVTPYFKFRCHRILRNKMPKPQRPTRFCFPIDVTHGSAQGLRAHLAMLPHGPDPSWGPRDMESWEPWDHFSFTVAHSLGQDSHSFDKLVSVAPFRT